MATDSELAFCSSHGVDDIEDIFLDPEDSNPKRPAKAKIYPHKKPKTDKQNEVIPVPTMCDSVIPGTQRIFVKTWGCSHNNSDSEYMAGQLASYGYVMTDDKTEADLWLLNSCTVKNPAEDHFRNEIKSGRQSGKHIVLAGCVPQGAPKADYIQGLSVIGVQQIDRVVEVVEETLKGHSVRLFGQKKNNGKKIGGAQLSLPKIRKNPLIEIIAINTGCLNQCTYCKTKHARGDLGSYPIQDIVARAEQSFKEGVVEVWLTSEDLGAYGHDISVRLPDLLWELVKVIPEGAMLRLGMTNPPYILEHLEEVAKILNHDRVYSFLHVPVQSASDAVLTDMRREYCQADFRQVANVLKARVPEVTIATDVICGFPTETEEDFEETLQLVQDYKFPSLFINQFFPRPGTPAARMPRLPGNIVKQRTKKISDLFQSYFPYNHKVGRTERVLVTEVSHDNQFYVAHNKSYDQVLVPKKEKLLGKMVLVKIVSAGKHFMKAEVVEEAEIISPNSVAPLPKGNISGKEVIEESTIETGHSQTEKWVGLSLGIAFVVLAVRIGFKLKKSLY